MISEIHNWIDKKLSIISNDHLFLKYFAGIKLNKIEDAFYFTNNLCGIEIVLSYVLIIQSIHLFFRETRQYGTFAGLLPLNLAFSFYGNKVYELFGKPKKSGGGNKALYIGDVPNWDKNYFEAYSLHIQYSAKDYSIDLITIASLKLEEYFNSELE